MTQIFSNSMMMKMMNLAQLCLTIMKKEKEIHHLIGRYHCNHKKTTLTNLKYHKTWEVYYNIIKD